MLTGSDFSMKSTISPVTSTPIRRSYSGMSRAFHLQELDRVVEDLTVAFRKHVLEQEAEEPVAAAPECLEVFREVNIPEPIRLDGRVVPPAIEPDRQELDQPVEHGPAVAERRDRLRGGLESGLAVVGEDLEEESMPFSGSSFATKAFISAGDIASLRSDARSTTLWKWW